jgi:hypothetical protein
MTISISFETWQRLLAASAHSGFSLEPWEIGENAVHDWLARNDPEALAMPSTSGYQWKQLFLPKGTLLRTVFNGKNHHCVVEDDGIRFNGELTSPSGFANAVGGVRRNAWRVIWVLFPNTSEWKLADTLRPKRSPTRRTATGRQARAESGLEQMQAVEQVSQARHQRPRMEQPAAGAMPSMARQHVGGDERHLRTQRRSPDRRESGERRQGAPCERRGTRGGGPHARSEIAPRPGVEVTPKGARYNARPDSVSITYRAAPRQAPLPAPPGRQPVEVLRNNRAGRPAPTRP